MSAACKMDEDNQDDSNININRKATCLSSPPHTEMVDLLTVDYSYVFLAWCFA